MPIDSATLQTLLPPSFYQNGQLTVSHTEAQTVAAGIQGPASPTCRRRRRKRSWR